MFVHLDKGLVSREPFDGHHRQPGGVDSVGTDLIIRIAVSDLENRTYQEQFLEFT